MKHSYKDHFKFNFYKVVLTLLCSVMGLNLQAQNRWSNSGTNGVFDTTTRKGAVIIGDVNFNRSTPVSDANFVFLTGKNSISSEQTNNSGTRWGLIANGKLGFNRTDDRWMSFGDRLPWENSFLFYNSIGVRTNWGKYNSNFGTIFRDTMERKIKDGFISWQDSTVNDVDSGQESGIDPINSRFRFIFRTAGIPNVKGSNLLEYLTIFPNGVVNVGYGKNVKPNAKFYVENGNIGNGFSGAYGSLGGEWTSIGKSPFNPNDIGFRAQSKTSAVYLTASDPAPFNSNANLIWGTTSANAFNRADNGLQFQLVDQGNNIYNAMTLRFSTRLNNGFLGINVINPDARLDVRSTGDGEEANRGTYVVRSLQQWVEDFNYNTFIQSWGCKTKAFVISGPNCSSSILTENFSVWADGKTGIRTMPDDSFSLKVNGIVRATQFSQLSDVRFKENIVNIQNPMEILKKINSYEYDYKQGLAVNVKNGNSVESRTMELPTGRHFGYLAQEIKELIPAAVTKDQDGFYSVDYIQLIPLLSEAIKIQSKTIDSLVQIVEIIRNRTNIQPTIQNENRIFQNIPNPYENQTVINYELKQDAMIVVTKLDGTTVLSFDVKGSGSVTLENQSLLPGLYYYSLIVNGQVSETKTLIKK